MRQRVQAPLSDTASTPLADRAAGGVANGGMARGRSNAGERESREHAVAQLGRSRGEGVDFFLREHAAKPHYLFEEKLVRLAEYLFALVGEANADGTAISVRGRANEQAFDYHAFHEKRCSGNRHLHVLGQGLERNAIAIAHSENHDLIDCGALTQSQPIELFLQRR